jgi:hypothetical protein
MMLISALLVGFTTVVISDQRYRFIDKDRGQAFYAATAGVEKLTADLSNTFLKNVGITNAMVTALTPTSSQPVITSITYTASSAPTPVPAGELSSIHCYSTAKDYPTSGAPAVTRSVVTVGSSGYTIMFCANSSSNNPTTLADAKTITQGTYAGLYALKSPFQIDVTAKSATGGEVHLSRVMEMVSIPMFQFGIFCDVDCAFHSGDNFAFGGRVHTNSNLYLAVGSGNTLTLSDKVTAYKDVIRAVLPNGNAIANNGSTGTVSIAKGGGTYRALDVTEGSVQAGPGSTPYAGDWTALSLSTYKGWLKDGAAGASRGTGARQLQLPIVTTSVGGTNIDLIRRPPTTESTTSILYQERLFTKASIRVLLSDTAADINNVPGVDSSAPPLSLEAGTSYGNIPIAVSPGTLAQTPVITNGTINVGTSQTLQITTAQLAQFKIPDPITITNSGKTWTLSACGSGSSATGKDPNGTAFTGCTLSVSGAAQNIPSGATATGTLANGQVVTTTTSGTTTCSATPTCSTNRTVNVTSTLAFSPTTFWVDDQVVSCTGYNVSAAQLTGCNVLIAIPNNEKIQTFASSQAGTSLIGGYVKVERLNASDSTWHDITPEILNWGIAAPAEYGSCAGAAGSTLDPSPNAILRLQRLADDGFPAGTCVAGPTGTAGATGMSATHLRDTRGTDYWPNTLFDARESWNRSAVPPNTNIKVAGVMNYVAVDVANLAKWFAGQSPYNAANPVGGLASTGTQAKPDNTGYSIYVSDRRSNRDSTSAETAEFGFEDYVNPGSSTGAPNNTLDAGEDVNANGQLDVYGRYPSCGGSYNYTPGTAVGTVTCALGTAQNVQFTSPWPPDLHNQPDFVSTGGGNVDSSNINGVGRAMTNRTLFFRRAVKLIRGTTIAPTIMGLTVVTENPVYVQGDWNASGGWSNPHAATAILADAVTLLSNAWDDRNSFLNPYDSTSSIPAGAGGGRKRSTNSWYRFAVLAGKSPLFPLPSGQPADFGSDGGVHNFLRMLEGSVSGDVVNYQGAMANMFYNRQAVGTYKIGNGSWSVYGVPSLRAYQFDQDFLQPTLLPPLTPMFRDMDATGFSQNLQPGK